MASTKQIPADAAFHYSRRYRALGYPLHRIAYYTFDSGNDEFIYDSIINKLGNVGRDAEVSLVLGEDSRALLIKDGREIAYDSIIVCVGSGRQALSLVHDGMNNEEKSILRHFDEVENALILHTDTTNLGTDKSEMYNLVKNKDQLFTFHDLNLTLDIDGPQRYFLSFEGDLSGKTATLLSDTAHAVADETRVIARKRIAHPVVSASQWRAIQNDLLAQIQGKRNIYYAGSWTNAGEGSHEYAYVSGRRAAAMVLGEPYQPLLPKPISSVHTWISRVLCLLDRS